MNTANLGSASAGPTKEKALASHTLLHLSPKKCCSSAPKTDELRCLVCHRAPRLRVRGSTCSLSGLAIVDRARPSRWTAMRHSPFDQIAIGSISIAQRVRLLKNQCDVLLRQIAAGASIRQLPRRSDRNRTSMIEPAKFMKAETLRSRTQSDDPCPMMQTLVCKNDLSYRFSECFVLHFHRARPGRCAMAVSPSLQPWW